MSGRDSPKDLFLSFLALIMLAGALAAGAYFLAKFCLGLADAHQEMRSMYTTTRRFRGSSPATLVLFSGAGALLCAAGSVGVVVLGLRYYGAALFGRKEPRDDAKLPPLRR